MRPGFVRVIQYLWLFAVGLSLLCAAAAFAGMLGEFSLLSILVPELAGLPLSALVVPMSDVATDAGYRPGWFGEWATVVALGALQWFVLVPLALRVTRCLISRRPANGRRTP
jgi:hypothetical protein